MNQKKSNNISYLLSVSIHALLILLFGFITISQESEEDLDFVTVGFGAISSSSSTGAKKNIPEEKKAVEEEKEDKKEAEKTDQEVNVPETKNTDPDNDAVPVKDEEEEKTAKKEEKPLFQEDEGNENIPESLGNYGFDIDWGGLGVRRIYSWEIPPYPEGVSKEIDVKLRFTIMPDGTVGRVFPLIKADTQLENAAINALRKWRFEPLSSNKQKKPQTAVITFPFRLN